jgi:hypothetical protein
MTTPLTFTSSSRLTTQEHTHTESIQLLAHILNIAQEHMTLLNCKKMYSTQF